MNLKLTKAAEFYSHRLVTMKKIVHFSIEIFVTIAYQQYGLDFRFSSEVYTSIPGNIPYIDR